MEELANALQDQARISQLIQDMSLAVENPAGVAYGLHELLVRLEVMDKYWSTFIQNDMLIQRSIQDISDQPYIKSQLFAATSTTYIRCKAWFKSRVAALSGATSAAPAGHLDHAPRPSTQAALELVKLPTFSGVQREWEPYKEQFEALVLNDLYMPPIIKFRRLLSSLQGEALSTIQSIRVVADNFNAAWSSLCEKYDNKPLRFSLQMQALEELPSETTESATHITLLLNALNEAISNLKDIGLPTEHWDSIFIYFATSRLADNTRVDWVKHAESSKLGDFPKFEALKLFLQQRARSLGTSSVKRNEDKENSSCKANNKQSSSHKQSKKQQSSAVHATSTKNAKKERSPCSFCQSDHFLAYCDKFLQVPMEQRKLHISKLKLCTNCLNTHALKDCISKRRCFICGEKHHTKLHEEKGTLSKPSTQSQALNTATYYSPASSADLARKNSEILLSTALVTVEGSNGRTARARVLLDSCAEDSFITEHLAQALSLSKERTEVVCSGLGAKPISVARARVRATLTSPTMPEFRYEFYALVLGKVAADSPSTPVSSNAWVHLHKLPLADPTFNLPGRIDAILSARVFSAVLQRNIVKGLPHQPSALETVFGWVIIGAEESSPQPRAVRTVLQTGVAPDQLLTETLSRFWEVESVPFQKNHLPEEEACLRHFKDTHSRNESGRFVVRLPFRQAPVLPGSRSIAEACLDRLLKKFAKQPEVAEAYRNFMSEYLSLNHMELVPSAEQDEPNSYYIPHHCVFKRDSGKIRVVFNASQPCSNGLSLNSCFLPGPNMQDDVFTVILRWAFSAVVVTCDVVKMYRQFLVHEKDRNWQRIVWQESAEHPRLILRLSTVTYGEACASFQANACMIQLAQDGEGTHPRAAKAIRKNRYMDDFYLGEDSEEELEETKNDLLGLLSTAGMEVGKWASNSPGVLQEVPHAEAQEGVAVQQDEETVSTLGLRWHAAEDVFRFKISTLSSAASVTKRAILADVAKLYDPIGFLAAVIITGKILMQNLWLLKLSWDEAVPEKEHTNWLNFRNQLPELEEIKIPRWAGTFKNSEWDLHCFCDASERAYAGLVYVTVRNQRGWSPKLLTAKAKVAPIKVISLPKLELCGALLLSRLVAHLIKNIELQPSQIHCWTDSRIVLAWLQGHPNRWKTFVANRVSEITTKIPNAVWHHVCSEDNPADLASRGVTPSQLRTSTLWWSGPEWLKNPSSEWPVSAQQHFITELEQKKTAVNALLTQSSEVLEWASRFSSIEKLTRILAWIFRWYTNSRRSQAERRSSFLSVPELQAGREWIFKALQGRYFDAEIKALSSGARISRSSPIVRLAPFLDEKGLLRVGGRLQNSYLHNDEKHPIILHAKNHVSRLIISQAHLDTCHGGPSLVQGHLSRQFWLIRGRNFIRQVVRQCVICARHQANTTQQQMGQVPAFRIRPSRPFTCTGVDYAGPFLLKASPGRGQKVRKSYVAIFVCMVVRAVHIEVVSDLTSAAFLAAYRRFVARRGLPSVMHSDNGTTFKGADVSLKSLFQETSNFSEEVAEAIAKDRVQWSFIPPRAPNFGGLWEANVRSFKRHLYRVIGETKLTFEEFSTVAATIEACLNSRPLSALSQDPGDLSALTPGHFLIGSELVSPPEPFTETNETPTACSRWHLLSLMKNHFWKRWKREFLREMQQRSKWLFPNDDVAAGDLVLFKDELLPPTKWPLGRIVQLYPGPDGLSRVARIKTAAREYTRPLNKLVKLPVNREAQGHVVMVRSATAGGDIRSSRYSDQDSR